MALVPRFYEPTAGEIRIDGLPLASMTLESLRRQVGLVSQDVFLFAGTLRENIAYGRLGATEAQILMHDSFGLLMGSMLLRSRCMSADFQ